MAVVGYGDNHINMFVDGVQFGPTLVTTVTNDPYVTSDISGAYDFTNGTGGYLVIGNKLNEVTGDLSGTSIAAFNGFITNFRWVGGSAVYTGNFQKPTSRLRIITGTKLLLLSLDNGPFDDSNTVPKIALGITDEPLVIQVSANLRTPFAK